MDFEHEYYKVLVHGFYTWYTHLKLNQRKNTQIDELTDYSKEQEVQKIAYKHKVCTK